MVINVYRTRKSNAKHAVQRVKRTTLSGNTKTHRTKELYIRVSIVEMPTSIVQDSRITQHAEHSDK